MLRGSLQGSANTALDCGHLCNAGLLPESCTAMPLKTNHKAMPLQRASPTSSNIHQVCKTDVLTLQQ